MGVGKFERGEFGNTNKKYYQKHKQKIEGKPLHYVGDGTGRDFYVMYF